MSFSERSTGSKGPCDSTSSEGDSEVVSLEDSIMSPNDNELEHPEELLRKIQADHAAIVAQLQLLEEEGFCDVSDDDVGKLITMQLKKIKEGKDKDLFKRNILDVIFGLTEE